MKKLYGQTLIELVIFIVIISIVTTASLSLFQIITTGTPNSANNLVASQLAHAHMNLIIQQRFISGIGNISDPCQPPSTLDACVELNQFASNHHLIVTTTTLNESTTDSTIIIATVNVTGQGFASETVRFVQ